MKLIFKIVFLLLICSFAKAQTLPSVLPNPYSPNGFYKIAWIKADNGLILPLIDTTYLPKYTGTMVIRPQDHKVYYYDSTTLHWNQFSVGAQIDTTSLSNRINLKLNISDTAAMLSPYLRKTDTTNKWVQNVYARNDSLFKQKNGTETFIHTFPTAGSGTVTSVGLSMPSAFTVTNSPVTGAGTLTVTGAGTSLQYIRGNGTLATFDTTAIPNFYSKVQSLFSGTSPITYSAGVIGINNATATGTKGAATFTSGDFSDNGSGTISLADVTPTGACLNCQLSIDSKGRIVSYADGADFSIFNTSGAGDTLLLNSDSIKRLNAGFGLNSIVTAASITHYVDTNEIATLWDVSQAANISNTSLTANGNYSQNWNNKQLYFDSISTYLQFKAGGIGSGGTRRKEFTIAWGGSSFGDNLDGFNILSSIRKSDNSADSLRLGIISSGTGVLSMGTYNVANAANNTFISYNINAGLLNITAKDSIWIRGAVVAATADSILGLEDRGNGLSKLKKIPLPSATTLDNIGSGYRWVATSGGNIKTSFVNNTLTIDSSSNSNGLTFKVDTNIIGTKRFIDSSDAYIRDRTIGLVLEDKFQRVSLGSDYQSTVTDLNVALTGAKMTFKRGTNGGFANYITDTVHKIGWQKLKVDLKFTIDSVGGGIGLQFLSVFGTNNYMQARINTTASPATVDILSNGNLLKTGTNTLVFSIGDTILLSLFRFNSQILLTARNLNKNNQIQETYTYPLTVGTYTYSLPNIARCGIMSFGGNQSIYDYRFTSFAKKKTNTVFLGTSVTTGYGSTSGFLSRFPARVYNDIYDQFEASGGGFEKTEEMLLHLNEIASMQPEAVFIEAGLNDGGNTVAASVFQANLDSIVHFLQNTGIRVILSTVQPSIVNNTLETQYNASVNTIATNRSCAVVDFYGSALNNGSGALAAIYDGGDGVHPNDVGHWYIASLINTNVIIDTSDKKSLFATRVDTLANYNYALIEPGTNRIGFMNKANLNIQEITNNGNSTTNAVLIQPITASTTESQLRVGNYEFQSFATNNIWMGDNLYFGGAGFKYRQTGFGNLIQFNDGQMMGINFVSKSAGSTASGSDLKVTLKTNTSGNVGLGGNISSSAGSFSGGVLYIDNSGEVRIGNSFTDVGTFSFQNTGGLYQNGTFRLQPLTNAPSTYNILIHGLTDSIVYQTPYNTDSLTGTATNSNAGAGKIGESIESYTSTYTNYTTTATYQAIDSITLTPGDWIIDAQATFSTNGATITGSADAIFVISTTRASASGATEGKNIAYIAEANLLGTSHESISIVPYTVKLSSTTKYYLNSQATFTLGNPQYVGGLHATRPR